MKGKCTSAVCVSCVTLMNLSSSSSSSSPLFALCSSSSFSLLPSLFWACLSQCCAARRKDTLMLSLLGCRSGTSLWGARALTLSQHQLVLSCWLVLMLWLVSCWPVQQVADGAEMTVFRNPLRWGWRALVAGGFFRLISILSLILIFFPQPNSVAAKLLEGKNRRGSDSADYYHRTWSGGKDKVSDVPAWSTHYGVPQFPAKTVILNALPTSNQRKQPSASSVNFYQPSKGETSNRAVTSSNHHLSALPAARGHSHTTRASSQPHRRRTDSHRHLLQVSQDRCWGEALSHSQLGFHLISRYRNLELAAVVFSLRTCIVYTEGSRELKLKEWKQLALVSHE